MLSPAPLAAAATCKGLGWDVKQGQSSCGASKVGGTCHKKAKGVARAQEICQAAGARLCSVEELQDGVAAGTGCRLDASYVWTSTPCADGPGYIVVDGAPSDRAPKCKRSRNAKAGVRCCAASGPPAAPAEAHVAPSPPAPAPATATVSGVSKLAGKCYNKGTTAFDKADSKCSAHGARLCSIDELRSDMAADTGCGLDNKFVWTRESCGADSFLVADGSNTGRAPECRKVSTQTASVRCCLDGDAPATPQASAVIGEAGASAGAHTLTSSTLLLVVTAAISWSQL